MANKFTIGDFGEILSTGGTLLGSAATFVVGGLTLAGFLMKHADNNYHQHKMEKQREEMSAEMAYLIKQEVRRQKKIEEQYYIQKKRQQNQSRPR